MKILPLSNSKVPVMVDDEDFDMLVEYTWRLLPGKGYIARSEWDYETKQSKLVYLHRFIMGTPKGMDTDHIDINPFNNQRMNLRIVTRSQNMANSAPRKGLSQYKGVSLLKRPNLKKPWLAYVRQNYKTTYLGYFATEKEAAMAYNAKAVELFGDSAYLNEVFPDVDEL